MPSADGEAVARIVREQGVPETVAELLSVRGIVPEKAASFLTPSLRTDFPDPFKMAGMRDLAEDVAARLMDGRGSGIAVFADFDVDGATSAAILARFFRHFGLEVPVYIPERLTEGYGPGIEALEKLKASGAEFLLMADCGTTAFKPLAAGAEMGLGIAVLDHHEAEDALPVAAHVVNPKRKDDISGLTMLAACGVVFLFCVAVNAVLRERGFYTDKDLPEPDLKSWMDLVALGTVCDMVPMVEVNRLLVRFGFRQMEKQENSGIVALCQVTGLEGAPQISDAGFVIGPRINAGSRVHRSDLGARLLATDDPEEAHSIAWTLEECNTQRRILQSEMTDRAVERVAVEGLDKDPVIVLDDPEGHPGLAGLVAGRLKERYGKPAAVITYAENGEGVREGRGSGRSVPGINIAAAFIDARNAGLLLKGGGHAMAGGFTVLPEQVQAFQSFLIEHVQKQMQGADITQEIILDGVLTVRGAQVELVRILETQAGPFGSGYPEPVFAFAQVRLHGVDVLKDRHIRVLFSDWEGGARMKGMLFHGVDTPLGSALLRQGTQVPFHLIGRLQINKWQGRESVELHIADGAPAMADGMFLSGAAGAA